VPTQEELDSWSISASIYLVALQYQDTDYRRKHPNHRCDTWHQEAEGRWICDHLIAARKKNKRLQAMKALHRLSSPFIPKSGKLREVAKSLYIHNL